MSHAASAFYPSPYKEAIIFTADGVGEWATTTVAIGIENKIEIKKKYIFLTPWDYYIQLLRIMWVSV